ncbi:hypothetical protein NKI89_26705 [Mesorhizobium sp. M0309]|uniref:hypothetical protein n=1 Tax=Mesorhizobium sp. M0309 TaxID=2956933 RepID=UPI0033358EB8
MIDATVRAPTAGKSPTVGLEGRCLGRCTVVALFRSRPVVKEIVNTNIVESTVRMRPAALKRLSFST